MVEGFVGKDGARARCGAEGASDRMVSAAGRRLRDEARIQGDLVGVVEVVVSPPLLGRLHGRRFLGDRRHVLLGGNIDGDRRPYFSGTKEDAITLADGHRKGLSDVD